MLEGLFSGAGNTILNMLHTLSISTLSVAQSSAIFSGLCIIMLVCFASNWKSLFKPFAPVKKRTWILLLLIVVLASGIRLSIISIHYEPDNVVRTVYELSGLQYLNNEKSIDTNGQGYAFLLSRAFFLFSDNKFESARMVAAAVNSLASIALVILVFLFSIILLKSETGALFSALAYSSAAVVLESFRATPFSHVSYLLAAVSVFAAVIFVIQKKTGLAILSVSLAVLANHVRLETLAFSILIAGLIIFSVARSRFPLKRKAAILIFAAGMAIFFLFPLADEALNHSVRMGTSGFGDSCFSMSHLGRASVFFQPLTQTASFPLWMGILSAIGLCSAIVKKPKSAALLGAWVAGYLFFVLASCLDDFRFEFSYVVMPLAILFGFGVQFIITLFMKQKNRVAKAIGCLVCIAMAIVLFLYARTAYSLVDTGYSIKDGDAALFESELGSLASGATAVSGIGAYLDYYFFNTTIRRASWVREQDMIAMLVKTNQSVVCYKNLNTSIPVCGFPEIGDVASFSKGNMIEDVYGLQLIKKTGAFELYRLSEKRTPLT